MNNAFSISEVKIQGADGKLSPMINSIIVNADKISYYGRINLDGVDEKAWVIGLDCGTRLYSKNSDLAEVMDAIFCEEEC